MSADVVQMHPEEKRLEARRIADRRPDVVLTAPRPTCPPSAALLHRVASLITTEDLPPARITVTEDGQLLIDCSQNPLVENAVRRWCAALDLGPVTETAAESGGFAAVEWSSSGYAFGPWCHVVGGLLLPAPMTDRFGVGVVAE